MQTRSLVSLITREAPSWSRTIILSLINDIHFLMLAHPTQQTRILDSTTGKDPLFSTVAGTYQYRANTTIMTNLSSNAYLVDKVYTGIIGSSSYKEIDTLNTIGDQSNAALVSFKTDPGTTTNGYYIQAYKTPKTISSESIELDVPINWHLPGVYEGVMGWIEKTDNGKSDRWTNFIRSICPNFWYDLNRSVNQQTKSRYDGGY